MRERMERDAFKPALGFSQLNRLYDRASLWAFQRTSFGVVTRALIKSLQLGKAPKARLLEFGCGPGHLAIQIKESQPSCRISAVDRDPKMLDLVRRNSAEAGVKMHALLQGLEELPEASYDRAYSTLVFHHLTIPVKKQILARLGRLLKPEGFFVLADFSECRTWGERLRFLPVQLVDGFETTAPHPKGWLEKNLPRYFRKVEAEKRVLTFLGPVTVFACAGQR